MYVAAHLVDHAIVVRSDDIPRIQEVQASVYHVMRGLIVDAREPWGWPGLPGTPPTSGSGVGVADHAALAHPSDGDGLALLNDHGHH